MEKAFVEMIENDIKRIDDAVAFGSDASRWDLFRELDGRYQACIVDFYKGMWWADLEGKWLNAGGLHDDPAYVSDNLKLIKSKLESFRYGANAVQLPSLPTTQVNVTTNLHVAVTFEQVRSQIEDMTSLTNDETKVILEKITEIEKVVNSNDSKKTKWEKVKPVLKWIADKSLDVGIKLLPLILKIQ